MLVSEETVDEVKTLLQQLIRNSCVNTGKDGTETKNALTIAKYWDGKGLAGMYRFLEKTPGRANLIAEYSSGSEGPTVIFGPSHMDVVPVPDEHLWDHPAFEAVEADGYIWGRGAIDMLYIVAAQAVAFANLVVNKSTLNGTVRCMFVADEEAGGGAGAGFITEKYPELIKADFALGEMGGVQYSPKTGNYLFGVAEKGVVFIRLTALGKSSHASMPLAGDNALNKLTEAMAALGKYQPPAVIQPSWTAFVEAVGLPWGRRIMANNSITVPMLTRTLHQEKHPLATMMHSLTTMTISPTVISSSSTKTNVIPDKAVGEIDFRTLPGQDVEYVKLHIRKALGEALSKEIKVETIITSDPNDSPYDGTALWESLRRILPNIVPGSRPVPLMAPGGTDLRFLRRNGVACYGIGLCDDGLDLPGILKLYHSKNERVSVKTLQLTTSLLTLLMDDLMKAKAGGGPGADYKSDLLADLPTSPGGAPTPPTPAPPAEPESRDAVNNDSDSEDEARGESRPVPPPPLARDQENNSSEDESDARYQPRQPAVPPPPAGAE